MAQFVMAQATWFGPNTLHENDTSNIILNYTLLDSAALSSTPSDLLIFNHVYGTPAGTHNAYMPNSGGIWYYGPEWSVFDETEANMNVNLAFNVLNPTTNGTSFVHTVSAANTFNNWSLIDHPLLNGHPEAVFFITKTWSNYVYDVNHVGIWYSTSSSKWSVYNEDGSTPLTDSLTFNIFIPDASTSYYKHVAVDSNYITYLDNPLLNGNPNARIFVVHDYTTVPSTSGYINDEIGVWYDGASWSIYTESTPYLFPGATFNVLIVSPTNSSAISDVATSGKLSLTPNPAKDRVNLTLDANTKVENIDIVTADGRLALHPAWTASSSGIIQLDVSSLSAGMYVVNVKTQETLLSNKLFIAR
jgi:hypothetical protein